jgi:hypothetical protein
MTIELLTSDVKRTHQYLAMEKTDGRVSTGLSSRVISCARLLV